MKSYFHITASSQEYPSGALWLILQYGAGLTGYILYAPDSKTVIKSQLLQINNQNSDSAAFFELLKKEIVAEVTLGRTILINYTQGYIAVPESLYKPESMDLWIDLINGQDPSQKILVRKSDDREIMHIHPIHASFHQTLMRTYPDIVIYPFQEFAHHAGTYHEDLLHLSFYHQSVFIVLYQNNTIQLNQAYHFETPEDVLYQLLNVCQHLHAERESLPLITEGFIDTDSSLYKLLDQYFPNIRKPEMPEYQYPENAATPSSYILSHIDRIISCVS